MSTYRSKEFWESEHAGAAPDSVGLGEGVRVIGGEDSASGAAALYELRRLAMQRVLQKTSLPAGFKVVELGSGGGYWAEYFLQSGCGQFTGTDISATAVERLRGRFSGSNFHCLADAAGWSPVLEAGPYDLGLAIDVLYHITDDELWRGALESVLSSVRPGGFAILADYFWAQPQERPSKNHVKHRPIQMYLDLLDRSGFSVMEIQPVFYLLDRIKTGPFRDHNRLVSVLLRALTTNELGLKLAVELDKVITKFLHPMNARCKCRMLLARKDP